MFPLRYLSLLPDLHAAAPVYRAIGTALTPALDALEAAAAQLYRDAFAETCSEAALARHEALLGLPAFDGTPAERRRRLLLRLSRRAPISEPALRAWLGALVGAGYELAVDAQAGTLRVHLAMTEQALLGAVARELAELAPAQLLLTVGALYVRHGALLAQTHGALAAHTHDALRTQHAN